MGLQTKRFTTIAGIALAAVLGSIAYGAVLFAILWMVTS